MVDGNPPTTLMMSHRIHGFDTTLDDEAVLRKWDNAYKLRARRYPEYVICDSLHTDLTWASKQLIELHGSKCLEKYPGR